MSNGRNRGKTKDEYVKDMLEVMGEATRILKNGGFLAIFFNARGQLSWKYLLNLDGIAADIEFIGCFPMAYSAGSVVQDNREGSLKSDYILIYQKKSKISDSWHRLDALRKIQGWTETFPMVKGV